MLVASATAEQHERDLCQLFSTLRCFGLVLNIDKCIFSMSKLEFLSHRVSPQGIRLLRDKVEAVQRFGHPRTVKALQRFLGLVNFYRRFLPNIAATMRPLTDALTSAPRLLLWNESMMSAFQQAKRLPNLVTLHTILNSSQFIAQS